jgi:hypothetical protein
MKDPDSWIILGIIIVILCIVYLEISNKFY